MNTLQKFITVSALEEKKKQYAKKISDVISENDSGIYNEYIEELKTIFYAIEDAIKELNV